MSIRIELSNAGGVLDYDAVETPQHAAETAIAMIKSAGELHPGDSIHITVPFDCYSAERKPDGNWYAINRDRYDGAPDGRNEMGCGQSEALAIADLIAIERENDRQDAVRRAIRRAEVAQRRD